uniref:Beta-xylosidase C-terminal Concanavalin A-like domain-containing protein n=1 Tax=Kwoniella dejecticola CBS 10117 TaxID=1296121 RepID=A0A1A6A055_9TREE|nr:uncharacterized protein I303_05713 [Kwoniella dejecticola CBS 10117]OBR83435.1 hypothetical protein I303_05713 [Kwoniella dejecticola CBS 10117]
MPARNPILAGFNPDPSICRAGSDYFLAVSSMEFFPGIPIYHSKNLVDWQLIGHALSRPSQIVIRGTKPGFGVFAPTLRYHNGRFYIATAICTGWDDESSSKGFYVSTDDIWNETSWSDPIYFDILGIDQDLFFDDDGRTYLSVAKRKNEGQPEPTWEAVWGVEVDLTTGRSLGQPTLLRRSTQAEGIAEGSHIFKRHDWYYLCVAEGGTEEYHQEWIFRSRSPLGPYEEPDTAMNPILHNPPHLSIRHTGHVDFLEGQDGRWWAVFLGVRPSSSGSAHLGRETFLAPVTWTADDWPVINNGLPIGNVICADLPSNSSLSTWSDGFTEDPLTKGWYLSQTPFRKEYEIRGDHLALYGNGHSIHDSGSPALLLKKQTFFSGSFSATLAFSPADIYEEAGITVFHSRYGFIALFITKSPNSAETEIVMRWTEEKTHRLKVRCQL